MTDQDFVYFALDVDCLADLFEVHQTVAGRDLGLYLAVDLVLVSVGRDLVLVFALGLDLVFAVDFVFVFVAPDLVASLADCLVLGVEHALGSVGELNHDLAVDLVLVLALGLDLVFAVDLVFVFVDLGSDRELVVDDLVVDLVLAFAVELGFAFAVGLVLG